MIPLTVQTLLALLTDTLNGPGFKNRRCLVKHKNASTHPSGRSSEYKGARSATPGSRSEHQALNHLAQKFILLLLIHLLNKIQTVASINPPIHTYFPSKAHHREYRQHVTLPSSPSLPPSPSALLSRHRHPTAQQVRGSAAESHQASQPGSHQDPYQGPAQGSYGAYEGSYQGPHEATGFKRRHPSCLKPAASCLKPAANCLKPAASCLKPAANCLHRASPAHHAASRCLLPATSCLKPAASCLKPAASNQRLGLGYRGAGLY